MYCHLFSVSFRDVTHAQHFAHHRWYTNCSATNRGNYQHGQSQWPRGLRRRSAGAHLLRFWVRIPPRVRMFVCCECCVLSGRGLCDGLITRPEESYRLWCVVMCDLETSWMRNHTQWGMMGKVKKTDSKNVMVRLIMMVLTFDCW